VAVVEVHLRPVPPLQGGAQQPGQVETELGPHPLVPALPTNTCTIQISRLNNFFLNLDKTAYHSTLDYATPHSYLFFWVGKSENKHKLLPISNSVVDPDSVDPYLLMDLLDPDPYFW
jgi:hypothetical protein